MVIILSFRIFILSDIDQAYINTPYKTKEIGVFNVFERKQEFSTFLKGNRSFQRFQKKIKANIIVSRTTLCTQKINFCMQKKFFFRKIFVAYEIRFAVGKKLGQIFKIT